MIEKFMNTLKAMRNAQQQETMTRSAKDTAAARKLEKEIDQMLELMRETQIMLPYDPMQKEEHDRSSTPDNLDRPNEDCPETMATE